MNNMSATEKTSDILKDSSPLLEKSVQQENIFVNDKTSSFSSQRDLFSGEKVVSLITSKKVLTSSSSFGEISEFFSEPKLSFLEINRINREISKKIPIEAKNFLKQEHIFLVKNKFNEGISKKEERRLIYIRWQLDRIDDADYGESVDKLEFFTGNIENFCL